MGMRRKPPGGEKVVLDLEEPHRKKPHVGKKAVDGGEDGIHCPSLDLPSMRRSPRGRSSWLRLRKLVAAVVEEAATVGI
jgi:hypothetical protein